MLFMGVNACMYCMYPRNGTWPWWTLLFWWSLLTLLSLLFFPHPAFPLSLTLVLSLCVSIPVVLVACVSFSLLSTNLSKHFFFWTQHKDSCT